MGTHTHTNDIGRTIDHLAGDRVSIDCGVGDAIDTPDEATIPSVGTDLSSGQSCTCVARVRVTVLRVVRNRAARRRHLRSCHLPMLPPRARRLYVAADVAGGDTDVIVRAGVIDLHWMNLGMFGLGNAFFKATSTASCPDQEQDVGDRLQPCARRQTHRAG